MIYLISDLHGGDDIKGFEKYLSSAKEDDLLIILGDIELNFRDTEQNRRFTEYFLSIDKKIAIIDGNHENHPYLRSFPETEWCGATVHRLSESIVYLKRGNIYTIDGKTFFVMGGCKSSQKWHDSGLVFDMEDPSEEETAFAVENLKKHGNKVDYVLTHRYGKNYVCPLQSLTDYVDENVSFTHWYSGHWHKQERMDEKHTVVYCEAIPLK